MCKLGYLYNKLGLVYIKRKNTFDSYHMHLTQFKAVIAASLLASGSIVVRSLESAIRQPLKGSTSSQYKRFDARCYGSFTLQPSHFTFFWTHNGHQSSVKWFLYILSYTCTCDCRRLQWLSDPGPNRSLSFISLKHVWWVFSINLNVYFFVKLLFATEQVGNVRSTMFILDPFLHISCFLDLRCAFATPDGPSCQRVMSLPRNLLTNKLILNGHLAVRRRAHRYCISQLKTKGYVWGDVILKDITSHDKSVEKSSGTGQVKTNY